MTNLDKLVLNYPGVKGLNVGSDNRAALMLTSFLLVLNEPGIEPEPVIVEVFGAPLPISLGESVCVTATG